MIAHQGLKKTLVISMQFVAALAALGILVGSLLQGGFTLLLLFPVIFVAGSGMIVVGTIVLLLPAAVGRGSPVGGRPGTAASPLIDHTTYGQKL